VWLWDLFKYRLELRRTRAERKETAQPQEAWHGLEEEWDYLLHAVRRMRYVAGTVNAEFVIISLARWEKDMNDALADFAEEHQMHYLDTSETFDMNKNPDLFLPNDGHFTEKGARVLSQMVWDFLRERDILPDVLDPSE